jgi:hypothetical protein
MNGYHVQQIKREEARPWILTKHYAHRMPSVSYAFGLYHGGELVGVCTFGTPATAPCRQGPLGKENELLVMELNRLCVESSIKNASGILVSMSLRLFPKKPKLIVSYADTGQNHIGYIYQATNWTYTGQVKGDTQIISNGRIMHRQTAKDVFKSSSISEIRKIDPNAILQRLGDKHRYVYFVGNKTQKKAMRKALRYPVLPYPKGKSKRYDAGGAVPTQQLLFG